MHMKLLQGWPWKLACVPVAALQPSISAPNLLQLGQLSSQLAASESQCTSVGLPPRIGWDPLPATPCYGQDVVCKHMQKGIQGTAWRGQDAFFKHAGRHLGKTSAKQ
eukprot:1144196-Pelagomonas_calceolata.AAC.4